MAPHVPHIVAPVVNCGEATTGTKLLHTLRRNQQLLDTLAPFPSLYVCPGVTLVEGDVKIEVTGEIFYVGPLETETPPASHVYEDSAAIVFAYAVGHYIYMEGRHLKFQVFHRIDDQLASADDQVN